MHYGMSASPYAANRLVAVISSCWPWGERRGLLPEGHQNPAARIGRFREESRERYLSTAELGRLGDAFAGCEARFGPHAIGALRLLTADGQAPWRGSIAAVDMSRPAERVVAFYNKRGRCEQWIKEGNGAIR